MKILSLVILVLFLSFPAFAETVNLKDGRSITGQIIEKNSSEIKIDLNGLTMTYYLDEIKDIDGQPAIVPVEKKMEVIAPKTEIPEPSKEIPVVAQEDPVEKKALILKFIDVFGTRRAMTQNFEALLGAMEQQRPKDVQNIRNKFKIDEVIDKLIPLYDKYFTSEDLKAYIDFYSSPKGQKLISNIGSIMKDSIGVGAEYLKEKFPEMEK